MVPRQPDFPWQPVPDYLSELQPGRFALLVVDMQYFAAHPQYGICARLGRAGPPEVFAYFTQQLNQVTPRISRLIKAARETLGQIVFTRVQSATADGRGRSLFHETLGLHVAPGSKESEILQELGARANDVIVSKTGGGSFYGTNLDHVLRNLKIEQIITCGVTTAGCLETTVREAADRSYKVILVDDACASYWREEHEAAIAAMAIRHAYVKSTEAVVARLDAIADGMTIPTIPAREKQST